MKKIAPDETDITGKWVFAGDRVMGDENCVRVDDLVRNHLVRLGHDESGWDALYRDPDDDRLWELIYPESSLHGGGPPALRFISNASARLMYGVGQKHSG
jgi:hypothetical protein